MMMTSIRSRAAATLAVVALVTLTACGSSDDASGAQPTPSAEQADAAPDIDSLPTADTLPTAEPAIENSPSLEVAGDALPPLEDPNNDAAVGQLAPVITGVTFDGSDVTIGGPTDGPTMLVFLAHWCPHCNDEIPEINKLRESGELPADLNIIGISTAAQPDRDNFPPSNWIVEKDWTYPVLADTDDSVAIQAFGGTGFPFTVMLESDGSVNARKSGSATANEIRDWIDTTLLR